MCSPAFVSLFLNANVEQWGDVMSGADQDPIRFTVEIERSSVNDPGAVLFGARSNSSEEGSITFSRLMVSHPGPLQLKITSSLPGEGTPLTFLYKFLLQVSENPDMGTSNQCLFVFSSVQSPAFSTQMEVEEWKDLSATTVSGRLSPSLLMAVLGCLPVFASWAVTVHISPVVSSSQGVLIGVQYRAGIEAVWTGHGLPRAEMSPYERLGVPIGCDNLKQIRTAYYKKSLQWHPDRWSGTFSSMAMSEAGAGEENGSRQPEGEGGEGGPVALYKLAVQEAFELVAGAYEELLQLLSSLDGTSSSYH